MSGKDLNRISTNAPFFASRIPIPYGCLALLALVLGAGAIITLCSVAVASVILK